MQKSYKEDAIKGLFFVENLIFQNDLIRKREWNKDR